MDAWFTAFAVLSSCLLAGAGTLLIMGYIGTVPAAISMGWRFALPTLFLPVIGPIWFASRQGEMFRRARWQLIGACALCALAAALIAAYGPYFADKLVAEAIEAQKNR